MHYRPRRIWSTLSTVHYRPSLKIVPTVTHRITPMVYCCLLLCMTLFSSVHCRPSRNTCTTDHLMIDTTNHALPHVSYCTDRDIPYYTNSALLSPAVYDKFTVCTDSRPRCAFVHNAIIRSLSQGEVPCHRPWTFPFASHVLTRNVNSDSGTP